MRPRPGRTSATIAAFVGGALFLPGPLRADESSRGSARGAPDGSATRDAAAAEALFDQGRKLLAAGKVRAACPKFSESYRLDPALGSLLNLATCHQLEGKTASAWGEFRDAEQQARRAGDTKRQKFASAHAAALEENLPKLIVTVVDAPTGLAVSRDGMELGEASFNTPLPVDPGEHVISAEAPGHKRWQTTIEATAGARASVVVPALEVAEASTDEDAKDDTPIGAKDRPGGGGSGRTVGAVVAATGLVSLAVGGVFAGLFFNQGATADACAAARCGADEHEAALATRSTYGTISGITLAVGAVGVVAGGIVFFTSGSRVQTPAPATARWSVLPAAGPNGASVSTRFAF